MLLQISSLETSSCKTESSNWRQNKHRSVCTNANLANNSTLWRKIDRKCRQNTNSYRRGSMTKDRVFWRQLGCVRNRIADWCNRYPSSTTRNNITSRHWLRSRRHTIRWRSSLSLRPHSLLNSLKNDICTWNLIYFMEQYTMPMPNEKVYVMLHFTCQPLAFKRNFNCLLVV